MSLANVVGSEARVCNPSASNFRAKLGIKPHEPCDQYGPLHIVVQNAPVPAQEGKWTGMLRRMKDGESVLVTNRECNSIIGASYIAGIQIATRKASAGTRRVWRVGLRGAS